MRKKWVVSSLVALAVVICAGAAWGYAEYREGVRVDLVEKGDSFMKNREYARAVAAYREAETIESETETSAKLRKAEDEKKRIEDAAASFESAVALWDDGKAKGDRSRMFQVAKLLYDSKVPDTPEAKSIASMIKKAVTDEFVTEATEYATSGKFYEASLALSKNESYGDRSDPRAAELKARVSVQTAKIRDKEKADREAKEAAKYAALAPTTAISDPLVYEKITGDVSLAVPKVEVRDALDGQTFTDGKSAFLLVYASAKNGGVSPTHVNPLHLVLIVNGIAKAPDIKTYGLSSSFSSLNLPPNVANDGWLCFVVPKSATAYTLRYDDRRGNVAVKTFKR